MSELLIGIQSMYKRFMKNIVFLAFLYILPFQVLLFFVSEVVSYTPTVYTELILGAFYLMFLLLQIPFIFLSNLPDDESISNREILEMVVQKFSSVYLLGLVFSLCVAIGLHFSIIPGIVIMVLGFFTPCIMVLETKPKPNMVKVIITLGLSRFFESFSLICLFSFLYISFEWILLNLIQLVVLLNPFIVILVKCLILALTIPFFAYLSVWLYKMNGALKAPI